MAPELLPQQFYIAPFQIAWLGVGVLSKWMRRK